MSFKTKGMLIAPFGIHAVPGTQQGFCIGAHEIVLKSDFKKGDSIYSFMSQAEIEESDKSIKASIDNGSVYDEMKRASERAAKIGETLIVSAVLSKRGA